MPTLTWTGEGQIPSDFSALFSEGPVIDEPAEMFDFRYACGERSGAYTAFTRRMEAIECRSKEL